MTIKELRATRGNKCEQCGARGRLNFAHLKPTGLRGRGRGSTRRAQDVQRHPKLYRLLCLDCHHEKDHRQRVGFFVKKKRIPRRRRR